MKLITEIRNILVKTFTWYFRNRNRNRLVADDDDDDDDDVDADGLLILESFYSTSWLQVKVIVFNFTWSAPERDKQSNESFVLLILKDSDSR